MKLLHQNFNGELSLLVSYFLPFVPRIQKRRMKHAARNNLNWGLTVCASYATIVRDRIRRLSYRHCQRIFLVHHFMDGR
jgi:hypothetical protein